MPLLTLLTPGVSYGRVTFLGRQRPGWGFDVPVRLLPRPSGTRTHSEGTRHILFHQLASLRRPPVTKVFAGVSAMGPGRHINGRWPERPLERMFELGRICGRSLQTAETCGRDAGTCKPASSVSTTFSPMGPAVRVSRRPSSLVGSPCVCVCVSHGRGCSRSCSRSQLVLYPSMSCLPVAPCPSMYPST